MSVPNKTKLFASRWLLLACISLLLSGLLSLSLAFSRMPWWMSLFPDPLFIRRILVVHVDLAVSVWLTSFPLAVWHYLDSKTNFEKTKKLSTTPFIISAVGIIIFTICGIFGGGEPILANYIPTVDNAYALLGLGLYFFGITCSYLSLANKRLFQKIRPQSSAEQLPQPRFTFPLIIGAFYFFETILALIAGILLSPQSDQTIINYETAMWAGGHLLQFFNVSFLLIVWLELIHSLGLRGLTKKETQFIFLWLGIPLLVSPLLFSSPVESESFREGFTVLMRWGIFPAVVSAILILLFRNRQTFTNKLIFSDIRYFGTLLTMFISVSGFIFGATIRGSDLRVPGHYHASLGAISMTYTIFAVYLFWQFGWAKNQAILSYKTSKAHVWAFGVGQWLHALGMVIAGSQGVTRKVYGVEQQVPNFIAQMGLGILGVGSAIAAVGGLLFLILWLKWARIKIK